MVGMCKAKPSAIAVGCILPSLKKCLYPLLFFYQLNQLLKHAVGKRTSGGEKQPPLTPPKEGNKNHSTKIKHPIIAAANSPPKEGNKNPSKKIKDSTIAAANSPPMEGLGVVPLIHLGASCI